MIWFRRKPTNPASPLWDYIIQFDPKKVALWLERQSKAADSSSDFLEEVILGCTLSCAADFLKNVGKVVREGVPTGHPDVIAFEGLAFSIIMIRQFHLAPAEYEFRDEPEALVEAYRNVIAQFRLLVDQNAGWSIQKEWNARVMQYAQFPGIIEPMERLMGNLLSLSDVQVPPVRYGSPTSNVMLSAQVMVAVQAFTLNIPEASAEAIKNVISEFGLAE